ncbi:MAG TPA: RNA polymerase sigma factor [Firmicutes bacterium]|nr:RNA polymerase sigma factor [Bacillota bacterium]
MRSNDELRQLYDRHVETIYRVCFIYLKNEFDTDDLVAETFYRLAKDETLFESVEHEKAWLIKVATNLCKNKFRHWWNKTTSLKGHDPSFLPQGFEIDETLALVMKLPDKYKTVIYMHYYEGYSAVEIAALLNIKESTVYAQLHRGRQKLKMEMEGVLR